MDLLTVRARAFALARHEGQRKKRTGAPYADHLAAVSKILIAHDHGGSLIQAAAWLHDTLEKTDTTLGELQTEFGFEIAELVYWLSDLERGTASSKPVMTAMRLSRAPLPAKLIKLADIIDNAEDERAVARAAAGSFFAEKREILSRMAIVEGPRLSALPLYRAAAQAIEG